jgi:hypothetical protein
LPVLLPLDAMGLSSSPDKQSSRPVGFQVGPVAENKNLSGTENFFPQSPYPLVKVRTDLIESRLKKQATINGRMVAKRAFY